MSPFAQACQQYVAIESALAPRRKHRKLNATESAMLAAARLIVLESADRPAPEVRRVRPRRRASR